MLTHEQSHPLIPNPNPNPLPPPLPRAFNGARDHRPWRAPCTGATSALRGNAVGLGAALGACREQWRCALQLQRWARRRLEARQRKSGAKGDRRRKGGGCPKFSAPAFLSICPHDSPSFPYISPMFPPFWPGFPGDFYISIIFPPCFPHLPTYISRVSQLFGGFKPPNSSPGSRSLSAKGFSWEANPAGSRRHLSLYRS